MKTYHHIEYYGKNWGLPIIAFDKLDGSNIRIEYSHKRGFYKFGTRKTMFDEKSEPFGFVINLFKEKYETGLSQVLSSKEYRNIQSFVCYFEVFGTKSKFGQHDFLNDEFDIVLFDVDRYKKGFIPPKEFVKNFKHLGIPEVIYEGNLNREFVQSIKSNTDLAEGVICKGLVKTKKGVEQLYYCKVKTMQWLDDLKKTNLKLFNEELKDYKIEADVDIWDEDPIYDQ